MGKQEVLQKIRQNQVLLKNLGVKRLRLFGSIVRGEQRPGSDLDFLVEFHKKSFDAYMDLKFSLEKLLGCRVDLVLADTLKPRIRKAIQQDLVDAA